MGAYTVVIIDDEKLARDSIKALLKFNDAWVIAGEAADGLEAIRLVDMLRPDLIFLDINIPHINGMDVLENLTHRPKIIFTTAYDDFAIGAFEQNAVDYLLKPFTDARFNQALGRAQVSINDHTSARKLEEISSLLREKEPSPEPSQSTIAIDLRDRIELLDITNILRVSASGNYVEIFTDSCKYLHYESMQGMEKTLSGTDFLRIHRSHIVRQSQIASLRKHINGEYYVQLKDKVELKVSRSNRVKIKKLIESMR